MTREITHMRAFALALESMGKPPLSVGRIAPTAGLVDQFFNDSTGQGDLGEVDSRGPWNEGEPWEFVEAPAFQDLPGAENGGRAIRAQSAPPEGAEAIQEVLVDELRDLLHAEKQLLKALPKMQKAARTQQLQTLLRNHLAETEAQVERLNECLRILGTSARAKPCKGMAGLVEEGEEVMAEGKKKEDAPADLSLIGAALRVEHYEIAAYTTARNMALQLGQPAVAQLLTLSLGEEQNAGQLLDQVAQPLMSAARMPSSVLVTI